MDAPRILIVTGGYLAEGENRLLGTAWKQLVQSKHARNAWLEAKVKATIAEPVLLARMHAARRGRRLDPAVRALLAPDATPPPPPLTEVVLATAIAHEGLAIETLSVDALLRGTRAAEASLRACNVVFISTTFLHDWSELDPVLARCRRLGNRVVVGGALAGTLHQEWEGSPLVDVLAVGYGEYLVPSLARWIHSGFVRLEPPPTGRLLQRGPTALLFSGVPGTLSLDELQRPDWGLAARHHGVRYRTIHYESVRGCPYRCAFCNYPYLFDDTRFRTKSADRMADDWAYYVESLGVEVITCLDSLFTMPTRRLTSFCEALIRRRVRVKWTCYARADDLTDPAIVALMRDAGCVQVQIGIESGDAGQLDRMTKRTTVRENGLALDTCRAAGLTTVISLIVGFPGETRATLANTCDFLADHPSDFHFLATFSTRVAGVPILQPARAAVHGLVTDANPRTVSPYWRHDTMSCADVGNHTRRVARALIDRRISLDATLFYGGILRYEPAMRPVLLDFQAEAMTTAPIMSRAFDVVHRWIDRRLAADVARALPVAVRAQAELAV